GFGRPSRAPSSPGSARPVFPPFNPRSSPRDRLRAAETTPGQNPPPPAGGTDAPLLIRSGKPGPYPSFQNPRPTLRTAPSSAEYPGTSPSAAPPPPTGGLLPGGRDGFPADVPPGEKRCCCQIRRRSTKPNPPAHKSAPAGTALPGGN